MMKCLMIALVALIIGVGIGYLAGRTLGGTATVTGEFNQGGDQVVLIKAGDKFHWGSAVHFKFGSPCVTPGDVTDCTIKAGLPDKTTYGYKCLTNFCSDPALGVDNEGLMGQPGATQTTVPSSTSTPLQTVYVGCDPGSHTAVTIPPSFTAARGTPFFLYLQGSPTFTATFPAGTCNPSDTLNQDGAICTVKGDAPLQTNYSYPIQVGGCTAGTGTISITAN